MNLVISSDLVEHLIAVLTAEKVLSEELLIKLSLKKKSIIDNDIKVLRTCMIDEQELIKELKAKQTEQTELLNHIREKYSLHKNELRLSKVIKMVPQQYIDQLIGLRMALQSVMEKVTRINLDNRNLLNFSIEHVRGMIQLFLQANDEPAYLYNMRGTMTPAAKASRVLNFQV
jgi:hypothetical protein